MKTMQNTSVGILRSLYGLIIFLMMFLPAVSGFAAASRPAEPGASTGTNTAPTLEGCFRAPDPGSRSGCIMEVAANEKDVTLCDLIEIPGMAHDCINGVSAVTTITQDQCRTMNEKFRDHCLQAAKQ